MRPSVKGLEVCASIKTILAKFVQITKRDFVVAKKNLRVGVLGNLGANVVKVAVEERSLLRGNATKKAKKLASVIGKTP